MATKPYDPPVDPHFPALSDAIDQVHFDGAPEPFTVYIRPSDIGHPCPAWSWLGWRWAAPLVRQPGRTQKLYKRGLREEDRIVEDVTAAGITVSARNRQGGQWQMTGVMGHVRGYIDAAINDELRKYFDAGWRMLEAKSLAAQRWRDILRKGFKVAEPVLYSQVQLSMKLQGLTRLPAILAMRNADTQEDRFLSIPYDADEAQRIERRAEIMVLNPTVPTRISVDPKFYLCNLCTKKPVCYGEALPERNCRTCLHVKPVADGQWKCRLHDKILSINEQRAGCKDQRYIFSLILGRMESHDPKLNVTQYVMPNGSIYTDEG